MKLLFVFLLLTSFLFGQKMISQAYNVTNLLGNSETILTDAANAYYVRITNADTMTTMEFSAAGRGSERIVLLVDNVSGTLKIFVEVGINVGEFGTAARNYIYTVLDSVVVADDGVVQQWFLNSGNYSWYDAPGNSWHIRFRQTGTQVNDLYPNVVRLLER